MDEFRVIRAIRSSEKRGGRGVVLGIGDDAALLRVSRPPLIATVDTMVEGVHFRARDLSGPEIGWRAAAAAISDIAAMGGLPRHLLVSLTAPSAAKDSRLLAVMRGVRACATTYGAALVGGDIVSGPCLAVSITVLGEDGRLRRSGARPGETVYVTGYLGDAAGGLLLKRRAPASLRRRFAHPTPRVREMRYLRTRCRIGAAIDISDGLSSELHHVARESKVGIEIASAVVPISPDLRRTLPRRFLDLALGGGEDFEILFTSRDRIANASFLRRFGVPVTAIGRVFRGSGVRMDGRPLPATGYRHGGKR